MARSPRTLDHLVHISAPGQLSTTVARFERLGFAVHPGGTHANGISGNALVALPSGTYIELFAFLRAPEEYPPGSPERRARETHGWADKAPGWADWALLGRPRGEAAAEYDAPQPGGRTRPDGERIKWRVTDPKSTVTRGALPFYCEDVTPRELRVPKSTGHTNGAAGIARIVLRLPASSFHSAVSTYSKILDADPTSKTDSVAAFALDAPSDAQLTSVLELRAGTDVEGVDFKTVFVSDKNGSEIEI